VKQMQTKLADLADRRTRKRTVKGREGRRRRRRVCARPRHRQALFVHSQRNTH
jgi:hypothetical protein